jgi:RND family efflux transporter MFP subunit
MALPPRSAKITWLRCGSVAEIAYLDVQLSFSPPVTAITMRREHRHSLKRTCYMTMFMCVLADFCPGGTLLRCNKPVDIDQPRTQREARRCRVAVRVLALLIAAVGAGCSSERSPSANTAERVTDVSIAVAESTTLPDQLEAVGTVRASQTADLASQIAGSILEVRVHEGDRVRAGQILAVIDDSLARTAADQAIAAQESAQQALSAAESQYALAESTLERYRELYQKKEISAHQFDQVRTSAEAAGAQRDLASAELARATAALAQARVSLGYAHVEAPFAGLVTQRQVDPGTFASIGLPLLTLEETSRYRLEATADEDDIRAIHLGGHADVVIDSLGTATLSGVVTRIVPSADPASRSFLVKIDLSADARLRSGLFGRALFLRGTRTALVIPKSAVVDRGQMQAVYVIDANNIATLRYVTVGNPLGQQIEVLSGLETGERVAAAPGERQLAGKRVELRP